MAKTSMSSARSVAPGCEKERGLKRAKLKSCIRAPELARTRWLRRCSCRRNPRDASASRHAQTVAPLRPLARRVRQFGSRVKIREVASRGEIQCRQASCG